VIPASSVGPSVKGEVRTDRSGQANFITRLSSHDLARTAGTQESRGLVFDIRMLGACQGFREERPPVCASEFARQKSLGNVGARSRLERSPKETPHLPNSVRTQGCAWPYFAPTFGPAPHKRGCRRRKDVLDVLPVTRKHFGLRQVPIGVYQGLRLSRSKRAFKRNAFASMRASSAPSRLIRRKKCSALS
jgi:hypothetical protein